jgi:hypothetical protein
VLTRGAVRSVGGRAQLLSYHGSGFLLGASCGGTQYPPELYAKHGLQKNHAYAVLSVADVIDRAGRPQRLIKLRNPWVCGHTHSHTLVCVAESCTALCCCDDVMIGER